jgi:hypothetical protein
VSSPGRCGRSRCASGASSSRDGPSTSGRSAGVSLSSTSHRPSCPRARRAMPRSRPGLRLPGPFPSRFLRRPGQVRGAVLVVMSRPRRASWGGSPLPEPCQPSTTHRQAGRSPPTDVWWHSSLCRLRWRRPAPRRSEVRGSEPVLFAPSWSKLPDVATNRFPVPGGVALSGTGHTIANPSPQVKGLFSIHRVLPGTSPLPPGAGRSSTAHAQGCAHVTAPG